MKKLEEIFIDGISLETFLLTCIMNDDINPRELLTFFESVTQQEENI